MAKSRDIYTYRVCEVRAIDIRFESEGRANEIMFQSKDKARATAAKGGQGKSTSLIYRERYVWVG